MNAFFSTIRESGPRPLAVLTVPIQRCRLLGELLFSIAVLFFFTEEGSADRITKTNGFNGPINAISEPDSNGTRYIGGEFTAYGQWETGGSAVVDALSEGSVDPSFPKINGKVYATVSDGTGGFFVGGEFTSVDGEPRSNAAHIAADGTVDSWAPNPNGSVRAMTLIGSTVYMGGSFTKLGDLDRDFAAAVSVDGIIDETWKPEPNNNVYTLAVVGSKVYLGGQFTKVNGETRNRLAAVSTNGELDNEWAPDVNGPVFTIDFGGVYTDTSYLTLIHFGGDFTQVNGVTRNHVAAIGVDGVLGDWNPDVNGPVFTLLCTWGSSDCSEVIFGGSFSQVDGAARNNLANVWYGWNTSTQKLEANLGWFNPNLNGPVFAVGFTGTSQPVVYIGGDFTKMGTYARSYAASVAYYDYSATASSWRPDTDGPILTLAIEKKGRKSVYLGGTFTTVRGDLRTYAAAVNSNGTLNSEWHPRLNDGGVNAVLYSDGTIFLGGNFTSVNGYPRSGVAALSTSGALNETFNPAVSGGSVGSIVAIDDRIYLGGSFTQIDGYLRNSVASLFRGTGGLDLSWDAQLQGTRVSALASSASTLFLGGLFTEARGTSRENVAAITTKGDLTPWDPTIDGEVLALATADSAVYVGGDFSRVDGLPRGNTVAIDYNGDVSDAWRPSFNKPVRTIRVSSSQVYLGGDFTVVTDVNESNSRDFIAAVSPEGLISDWYPALAGKVFALSISDSKIFVGGQFTKGGDSVQDYLAIVDAAAGAPIPIPTDTPTPTPTITSTPTETPGGTPTLTPTPTESPIRTPTPTPIFTPTPIEPPIGTPTVTPIPAPQPQPSLTKPVVKWSLNAASRRVRAFVSRIKGVSYTISGTLKGKERTGQCTLDNRTRKVLCSVRLTKGKWLVSITPSKQGVKGRPTRRWVTFRR
jgi:hypothetical protein